MKDKLAGKLAFHTFSDQGLGVVSCCLMFFEELFISTCIVFHSPDISPRIFSKAFIRSGRSNVIMLQRMSKST